jgi:hypothetical protein
MISNQENSEVSGHPNRSELSSTFNAFNNNNHNNLNEKPPIQNINNNIPNKNVKNESNEQKSNKNKTYFFLISLIILLLIIISIVLICILCKEDKYQYNEYALPSGEKVVAKLSRNLNEISYYRITKNVSLLVNTSNGVEENVELRTIDILFNIYETETLSNSTKKYYAYAVAKNITYEYDNNTYNLGGIDIDNIEDTEEISENDSNSDLRLLEDESGETELNNDNEDNDIVSNSLEKDVNINEDSNSDDLSKNVVSNSLENDVSINEDSSSDDLSEDVEEGINIPLIKFSFLDNNNIVSISRPNNLNDIVFSDLHEAIYQFTPLISRKVYKTSTVTETSNDNTSTIVRSQIDNNTLVEEIKCSNKVDGFEMNGSLYNSFKETQFLDGNIQNVKGNDSLLLSQIESKDSENNETQLFLGINFISSKTNYSYTLISNETDEIISEKITILSNRIDFVYVNLNKSKGEEDKLRRLFGHLKPFNENLDEFNDMTKTNHLRLTSNSMNWNLKIQKQLASMTLFGLNLKVSGLIYSNPNKSNFEYKLIVTVNNKDSWSLLEMKKYTGTEFDLRDNDYSTANLLNFGLNKKLDVNVYRYGISAEDLKKVAPILKNEIFSIKAAIEVYFYLNFNLNVHGYKKNNQYILDIDSVGNVGVGARAGFSIALFRAELDVKGTLLDGTFSVNYRFTMKNKQSTATYGITLKAVSINLYTYIYMKLPSSCNCKKVAGINACGVCIQEKKYSYTKGLYDGYPVYNQRGYVDHW